MKGFGAYKMMIQSTILQHSSINAVPDHFIKAIFLHRNVFFQMFFKCLSTSEDVFLNLCLVVFL